MGGEEVAALRERSRQTFLGPGAGLGAEDSTDVLTLPVGRAVGAPGVSPGGAPVWALH